MSADTIYHRLRWIVRQRRVINDIDRLAAFVAENASPGDAESDAAIRASLRLLEATEPPWPKRCGCGVVFESRDAWDTLQLCTSHECPDGISMGLEHRNCFCGSTLVVHTTHTESK